MRFRPYRNTDFEYIGKWITDERSHRLWCAGLIPFPMTREIFREFLCRMEAESGDSGFVMTENDGTPVAFCLISINDKDNSAFARTIVVDSTRRGQGLGSTLMQMMQAYVFDICDVDVLWLCVFDVNPAARRCYEKAGFVEVDFTPDAFAFKDEMWGRVVMNVCRD